jgi:hypothetical protein
MKKLKLEIEALTVESFESGGARERRGTVRGAGQTAGCGSMNACPFTVVGSEPGATCLVECTGTCGNTYGDCCGASGRFTCDYCYG